MTAVPLANIIGAPVSSLILGMNGVAQLAGWQWLFIIEGLPACLLAFAVLKFLPDGPADASWLSADEKATIETRLAAEDSTTHHKFGAALRDPRVLPLCPVGLGLSFGNYGVGLWLPQIVQGMGFSNLATGFVVAGPSVAGGIAMILWGRSSDRRGERVRHVAAAALLAAAALAVASFGPSNLVVLVALTFATIGIYAALPTFYSVPSMFLSGTAAAGGIALVNTFGTGLGGFWDRPSSGCSSSRPGVTAPEWLPSRLGWCSRPRFCSSWDRESCRAPWAQAACPSPCFKRCDIGAPLCASWRGVPTQGREPEKRAWWNWQTRRI